MSLQGFEGSFSVHFATVLCGAAAAAAQGGSAGAATPGRPSRARLASSAHRPGGDVPSCQGLSPPCRYLQKASLNNHKREQSNLLLQEKEQTLLSHARWAFRKFAGFVVGRALGARGGGEMGTGCRGFILLSFFQCSQFSHASLRDRTYTSIKHTPPPWLTSWAATEHIFQSLILGQNIPAAWNMGCYYGTAG